MAIKKSATTTTPRKRRTPAAKKDKAFFGANFSTADSGSGTGLESIIPAMYQAWGAYGYQPSTTWYQLATMYVSWVYTAIEKKARTLATLPPKLYRYEKVATGKTMKPWQVKAHLQMKSLYEPHEAIHTVLKSLGVKRVELDDHPFIELCNKPNPDMVRFNFWHLLGIHLELGGAVGIYKSNYFLGHPTRLDILPTTWTGQFKPIPGNTGIVGYKLVDQNLFQNFTKEEIIWPHYPSLRSPFEGMSAIKSQLATFNLDSYLNQQMIAFFKNNAMFANFFKTKGNEPIRPSVYDDLMKQLQNYQGPKSAYQPFLLNGLEVEKSINTSARDSMIEEIEKFARDKMLAAHDVSAGKVGLVESQNRSNLEAVNMNFFTESIKPLAMLITEYFNNGLVHEYDSNLDFEFDYPAFVERETDIREREANLRSGVTTINEERGKMGLPPDEGLEGVRFISRGMLAIKNGQVVDALNPAPTSPFGTPSPSAPVDDVEPKPDPLLSQEENPEDPDARPKSLQTKAFWNEERKEIAWKKFDRESAKFENSFIKATTKYFDWLEAEVIDRLEKHGVKIKSQTGAMNKHTRTQWLADHKDKLDAFLPTKIEMKKKYKDLTKGEYQKTLTGAAELRAEELAPALNKKADMSFEFDLNDPKVKKWLGDRLEETSETVSTKTVSDVKRTLRNDYEEGEPLSKMSEHLREYFDGGDTYRAALIARTETNAAYNKGDLESIRQLGLSKLVGKIWLTEPDARDTHLQAAKDYSDGFDGDSDDVMTIDRMFVVGGDTMDAPGNGALAEENCNCRCTMVYEVIEKDIEL